TKRTIDVTLKLLEGTEPLTDSYKGYLLDNWIRKWQKTVEKKAQISFDNSDDFSDPCRIVSMVCDNEIREFILLFGEEGSVKTYQQIRDYHKQTEFEQIGKTFDELIVVYIDVEEAVNESSGPQFLEN